MFTGIIQAIGTVVSANQTGGDLRLLIEAPELTDREMAIGDSIACNGVCLTIVEQTQAIMAFDVSIESIDHSLIGDWQPGTKVNLEMALLPTTRLGGHLVAGHVDGVARLIALSEDARSRRMQFEVPDVLKKYIAKKGSITIDGTSLTVNSVENNTFDINVIPHTLKVTTLGSLQVGDRVHIEVDLIARYLERLLSGSQATESPITQTFLADHGFA